MDAISIVVGGLAGLAYGITGYLKARKQGDNFEWQKLGTSVVIGLFAGIGAQISGVDIVTAEGFVATAGITVGIENIFKAIFGKK